MDDQPLVTNFQGCCQLREAKPSELITVVLSRSGIRKEQRTREIRDNIGFAPLGAGTDY